MGTTCITACWAGVWVSSSITQFYNWNTRAAGGWSFFLGFKILFPYGHCLSSPAICVLHQYSIPIWNRQLPILIDVLFQTHDSTPFISLYSLSVSYVRQCVISIIIYLFDEKYVGNLYPSIAKHSLLIYSLTIYGLTVLYHKCIYSFIVVNIFTNAWLMRFFPPTVQV